MTLPWECPDCGEIYAPNVASGHNGCEKKIARLESALAASGSDDQPFHGPVKCEPDAERGCRPVSGTEPTRGAAGSRDAPSREPVQHDFQDDISTYREEL